MLNAEVKKEEAEAFVKVSERYKTLFLELQLKGRKDEAIEAEVEELKKYLRELHIDEELRIEIGGSYRKGTFILSSVTLSNSIVLIDNNTS
ncbi:MAG: hypothetical protein HOH01_02815 [Candidatus Jacksonbacteria bacterium]|nr:hypothetical protein [Candidatus Jacksonbacteria bacterium]